MSKSEWDYNEEMFNTQPQPVEQPLVERLVMKESSFFFTIKLVILVLVLTFGTGILVTGVNQDRTNQMSIDEP